MDIDKDQVTPIHALLDAFALLMGGTLFLHESTITHLAHAVIEWAGARKLKIDAKLNVAHGRTYEGWDIYLAPSVAIHVFPAKMGLLGNIDSLEAKIAKVREEADKRIKEMVEAEMSSRSLPSPQPGEGE